MSNDVIVVVSKLKSYIKNSGDMNTSGNVAPALSSMICGLCDRAVENAKNDGRKTLMDRDFSFAQAGSPEGDVLVVVSKLKNYVKSSADMNTSGNVPPALSAIARNICDQAVECAKSDGRKTVMDRDLQSVMVEPPTSEAA